MHSPKILCSSKSAIYFKNVFYPGLPLILFGVVCLAAAVFSMFLPETRGANLPQTFDDVRRLPNAFMCCIRWVIVILYVLIITYNVKYSIIVD